MARQLFLERRVTRPNREQGTLKQKDLIDLKDYIEEVSASNTDANNGLSKLGNTIQLGGELIQNTEIESLDGDITLDVFSPSWTLKFRPKAVMTSWLSDDIANGEIYIGENGFSASVTSNLSNYSEINISEDSFNGTPSIKIFGLSTYADEAAALAAGLVTNTIYKTATGELRIKL